MVSRKDSDVSIRHVYYIVNLETFLLNTT